MPAPRVAVVVLNYDGLSLLQKYVPPLLERSSGAAVYVADNGSADGSADWLGKAHPSVGLIDLGRNYGFCGGYNRALAQVEADYFVLLNSDVEVGEGWLDPLLAAFEADPRLGAAQPKVRAIREPGRFEYAGAAGGMIDRFGYPFCRGRLFDQVERDEGQYDESCYAFWASGACMIVKSELYKSLGGLDERFFAHMEEIDLCWRLQRAGWRVACVPSSVVYHLGGATLAMGSPRKAFLNFRNNLLLLSKNLPIRQLFLTLPARLLLDGVAAAKFLLSGEAGGFWAVFRAHMAFWRALPSVLRERRGQRSAFPKLSELEGAFPRSVVFERYAKGRVRFGQLGWRPKGLTGLEEEGRATPDV